MNIGRLLSVAATVAATLGMMSAAEAAKRNKADDTVVVSGCARFEVPICTTVTSRKTKYIVNSAMPPIPRDTGVTVIGKIMKDSLGPCSGTWLQVISWKPNRLYCTQR